MGGKHKKRFGFLHAFLLICAFVLGAIYIFEANSALDGRFARESAEGDMATLRGEAKQLEIRFSEISSLNNLKELSFALNLEEIKNMSYIRVKSASPLVLGN